MDPALQRERELFRKLAMAKPVVENSKKKETKSNPKASSQSKSAQKTTADPLSSKALQGSSQNKLGVLAKIVSHMKKRHLNGDCHPLSFEEILDETNQLDLSSNTKRWLVEEALASNPKIHISDGNYSFKTPFNIKDKKGLLRLLKNYDQRGLGGIYLEDVYESLPNAEKCIKLLGERIVIITRPSDKKKVVFYNDNSCEFEVEEELVKLWRTVPVSGLDERQLDGYLAKKGLVSMQVLEQKKEDRVPKRKKGQKTNPKFKRRNNQLVDTFQDYSDKL